MPDPKRNKLSIYLIKSRYKKAASIIKNDPEITKVRLTGVGTLYYKTVDPRPVGWLGSFFLDNPNLDEDDFQTSSIAALLLVKLDGKSGRRFAVTFGTGRHLLADHVEEERFGLITVLNVMETENLRSMDKRTLSAGGKSSREQLAKTGNLTDFDLDFEKDLVMSITGKTDNEIFGSTISGRDALSISPKVDISNIRLALNTYLDIFKKTDYKKNFDWIDQLKQVNNPEKIDELDEALLELIKEESENVYMAIPDIIDWEAHAGFKYTLNSDDIYDELEIENLLDESDLDEDFDADDLKRHYVCSTNSENTDVLKKWTIYKWLNAEIIEGGHTYILALGKWYEVDNNFVNAVNQEINNIPNAPIGYIDYEHGSEAEYNIALAEELEAYLMDKKNIVHGGGRSRIEFCDVLTAEKHFIHVKKYGDSSLLSYLFNQGYVSAQLFASDSSFRGKVRGKIDEDPFKALIPTVEVSGQEYSICYLIIKKINKDSDKSMPFFSKVVLRSCYRALRGYRFNVYLDYVDNLVEKIEVVASDEAAEED